MRIIIGLGNPGTEYEKTRHNIGFMVIDKLAKDLNVELSEKKFDGVFYKDNDLILAKPLTYMNNSGNFVQSLIKYYDLNIEDLIVIQDDLDLPLGKASIKQKGSDGGHNGIKDIIVKLNTQEFKRLKIGIGRDNNVINYVLGKFSFAEFKIVNEIIDHAVDALKTFIYNDIRFVMNKFNGKF